MADDPWGFSTAANAAVSELAPATQLSESVRPDDPWGFSRVRKPQPEKTGPEALGISPEEYVARSQKAGREAGRTPEEQQQYLQSAGFSPENAKKLGQQYALEQARATERAKVPQPILEDFSIENLAKTGAATAERFARDSVLLSDLMAGQSLFGKNTREAQQAAQAYAKGEATPEQIKLLAREERLVAEETERGKTLGGKILAVMGSVPKVAGEYALGTAAIGAAGKGAQALGIGRAAAPVSLSGSFSPTAARAALTDPTLGRVVLTHAGRMAALTPIVPSQWVEEMQQRNMAEGKPANDLGNAPPALAHAYANMLVLGSMQKNFGLEGGLLKKAAVKGGIFAGEQSVADSIYNLADRQIEGANQFNTKYGTFEHLLSGNVGEAAREATVQAFTGALFAGLHEVGQPGSPARPDATEERFNKVMDEVLDAYRTDLDSLKKTGLSAEGASKRLVDMQSRMRQEVADAHTAASVDLTNRMALTLAKAEVAGRVPMTAAEVLKRMEIPGTTKKSALAERMAKALEAAEKFKPEEPPPPPEAPPESPPEGPPPAPPGVEAPVDYFHGAASEIKSLHEGHYQDRNVYGQGLYTTSDAVVARSYVKKNKKQAEEYDPTVHRVVERKPVKFYDMDATIPKELESYLRGQAENDFLIEDAIHTATEGGKPLTLVGVFDAMRFVSREHGESTDAVQERFRIIQERLAKMGYGGFTHVGGVLTGGKTKHRVKIYWEPENQLGIERYGGKVDPLPPSKPPGTPPEARAPEPATEPVRPTIAPPERTEAPVKFQLGDATARNKAASVAAERVAKGEKATYVDMDVDNMAGLVGKVGEKAATGHVDEMVKIVREELAKVGEAEAFRHAGDPKGDEHSAIVYGDKKAVDQALKAAESRIREYAKANGLEGLPHAKKGKAAGVGLTTFAEPFQKGRKPAETFAEAEAGTETAKSRKVAAPAREPGGVEQLREMEKLGLSDPMSPRLRPAEVHKFLREFAAGKSDAELKAVAKEFIGRGGRNRADSLRAIHDGITGARRLLFWQPDLIGPERAAEFETHGEPKFRPELLAEPKEAKPAAPKPEQTPAQKAEMERLLAEGAKEEAEQEMRRQEGARGRARGPGGRAAFQIEKRPAGAGEGPPEVHPFLADLLKNSGLAPGQQKLLNARMRGITLQEIGNKAGITREAVRKREGVALDQFRRSLEPLYEKLGLDPAEAENLSMHELNQRLVASDLLSRAEGGGVARAIAQKDIPGVEGFFTGLPLKIEALDRLAQSGLSARGLARKWLSSAGDLPPDVMKAKIDRDGRIAAYAEDVRNAAKDLKAAVGVRYERVTDADLERMNSALGGDRAALDSLTPEVRAAVTNMRQQIDALSHALIEAGAIEGKMIGIVDANLGSYMTRSYKVFTDPRWAKNVPEDVKNRFKSWMRAEIEADGRSVTDAELEFTMRKLLVDGTAAENPIAFLAKSKLGSKDLGILTRRKDVPEPLRALWGEYKDPLVNYANTVGRMANLLSNHLFLSRVREMGLGEFLFTPDQMGLFAQKFPNSDPVTIAAEGSETMSPLNGLVAPKEIKQAFDEVYSRDTNSLVGRTYMKILGMAKYAKTVGSPITHVRQVVGNLLLSFSRGDFSFAGMKDAYKALRADTPEGREYYRELIEQQIVGDSVHGNEFKKLIDDAVKHRDVAAGEMLGLISADRQGLYLKAGLEKAAKLYQAEDALVKIAGYEAEKAAYRKAFPEWSDEQVKARAAEIVRMKYPSWSQLPAAIRATRKLPAGPFVTFPAEMVRTTFQTARLAIQELRDPATRAIGARRLAYLTASFGLMGGLAMTSRMLAGVDYDEELAMRRFLPEWSKNNQLLHVGRDEKGQPRAIDLGPTDPNAFLIEPFQAAIFSGNSTRERVADVLDAITKPFVGEEVAVRPALDIARNKIEQTGGAVYNPEAPPQEKAKAVLGHFAKAVAPGAYEQLRRLGMAAVGTTETKTGKEYSLGEEALALGTGQRVTHVELERGLELKAKAFTHAVKDAESLMTSVAKAKGNVSDEDLRRAAAVSEGQRQKIFSEFREDVLAAEKLGYPREKILKSLKDAGLSEPERAQVMSGHYVPNRLEPRDMKGLPAEEVRRRMAAVMAPAAAAPSVALP